MADKPEVYDETELVKRVIGRGLYICSNLVLAKDTFGLKTAEEIIYEGLIITDITTSPVSFMIELDNAKSYVFYNGASKKARYEIKNPDDLLRMDLITADMKNSVEQKVFGDKVAEVSKHRTADTLKGSTKNNPYDFV